MSQTDRIIEKKPLYQIIAEAIRDAGVKMVFGLGSDDIIGLIVALENCGVSFCTTRHENNAVFAAEGYAAATRQLGVALIGRGPAFANAMHGIITASRSGSAVLIISGNDAHQVPGGDRYGPDYKHLDAAGMMAAAGIESFLPSSAPAAFYAFHDAMAKAKAGAAVTLHLPANIQETEIAVDANFVSPFELSQPARGSQQSIDAAVAILEKSRKPLLIAGQGAHYADARDMLDRLADKIGAVVATTLKGKDFFRGNPMNLGIIGSFSHSAGRRFMSQADCVLAFGASLNLFTTSSGGAFPEVPLIHVDNEPHHIGRWHRADIGIVGDVRLVAEQLLDAVVDCEPPEKPFHAQEVSQFLADFDMSRDYESLTTSRTLDARELAQHLDRILPSNRNLIYDSGNFLMAAPYISVADPHHFKHASDFMSMGAGFGTAIGFAMARPDETNVLVVGDGGFMSTLSELETVARLDVPIVIIVMNDCAFGAEYHIAQAQNRPGSSAWIFPDIDLELFAEAIGIEAATVRTLDDLSNVENLLSDMHGPILIDCKINVKVAAPYIAEYAARENAG